MDEANEMSPDGLRTKVEVILGRFVIRIKRQVSSAYKQIQVLNL